MQTSAHSAITQRHRPGFRPDSLGRWNTKRTSFALASCVLSLCACVYVPVANERDSAEANCKMLTQSMSLNSVEMHSDIGCHNGGDCNAVLAAAIVVTAGSALISGSIVLTGNTLHWLEYQGSCSDGFLNRSKQQFLDSLSKLKPAQAPQK